MARIVILGGGIGGIVAARELARRLDGSSEITLVDREGRHYFPPSFPWVAMGRRDPGDVTRPLAALKARGVRHKTAEVQRIDPAERTVLTSDGALPYDHLLIALGAQLEAAAVDGLASAAHHPYDLAAAQGLRDAIRRFRGGTVVIGVSRLPFKCPAAPYEMALLMDAHFRKAGVRERVDMEFFTPEPYPTPAGGEAIGRVVQELLEARGISFRPRWEMDHVDAAAKEVHFKGDHSLRYDLLVAVPPHTTCAAVQTSGLAKDGPWIPVDPHTLRASYDDVYAVGDVAKVPTPRGHVPFLPKAGVFAERHAKVAARNIAADVTGGERARWDGRGICFLETGFGKAGMLLGNFFGDDGSVRMRSPGRMWHWGKVLFERRWLAGYFRR